MDKTGHFRGQKALNTDAHFASIFGPFPWSFSLIFQAVTPYTITVRKFYCQNHKKNPKAPEKIFRGSRKNFSVFHEKFWPVSRDHFACYFKVIWPVPRFAFTGPTGANRKWARLRGAIWLIGPSWLIGLIGLIWLIRPSSPNWPDLYFTAFLPRWMYILPVLKILVFSGEGILSIFLLSL